MKAKAADAGAGRKRQVAEQHVHDRQKKAARQAEGVQRYAAEKPLRASPEPLTGAFSSGSGTASAVSAPPLTPDDVAMYNLSELPAKPD